MTLDEERLTGTLGQPALARILDRIRKWLARDIEPVQAMSHERARVVITDPTEAEREALGRLLGRNLSAGKRLTLRLAEVEELLRHAGIAPDLVSAVTWLCGPPVNQRIERENETRVWMCFFAKAAQKDTRPVVQTWLAELRGMGLLRRLASDIGHGARLLDQAMACAALLPADNLLLKELAVKVSGDAHALDEQTVLHTLVARLAAALSGGRQASGLAGRRDLWEKAGLIIDELSPTVLVSGLPAAAANLTGKVLQLHAAAGEPCRLSLRQHRAAPPKINQPMRLYVCENPAVIQAAAMRLGPDHAPLLCLEGQPSGAAQYLLEYLRARGAEIRYHGDFDWPGIAIANGIIGRYSAEPWRMTVAQYIASPAMLPLSGEPVSPVWDQGLGEAMQQRGLAVHEEAIIADLLADLRQKGTSPS